MPATGSNLATGSSEHSAAGPGLGAAELVEQLPPPRLLDRLRREIRTRHYSIRTERAYADWARRFILFHDKRHPQHMGVAEVSAFLTHLATERNVSATTQNQAKSALLFLYSQVLKVDVPQDCSFSVRAEAVEA